MQLIPRPFIRRLGADARGVAAVEFALLVPILVLLYFGMAELTQGALAERRAQHTASSVSDLVAQDSTITAAQVDDVFDVGGAIVYPFPTTSLQMRVTSITTDSHSNATVDWSRASGGMTALTKGSSITVSSNIISASQSVIRAETTYVYTPAIGLIIKAPITFHETSYSRPRLSNQVTCADC
jgi:Flp pilus assembly protein TadG